MAISLVDPVMIPKVALYQQVSVAQGTKLVFIAGQVAWDVDGNPVGVGDLAAQVEQCYLNVAAALADVGGSFDDVAKLTVYFTDWSPDKLAVFDEGVARAAARLGVPKLPRPPITGIGVAALAAPDLLVEVEAVAVLQ